MDSCQECKKEFEVMDLFIGSLSGDESCDISSKIDVLCSNCYHKVTKKRLFLE